MMYLRWVGVRLVCSVSGDVHVFIFCTSHLRVWECLGDRETSNYNFNTRYKTICLVHNFPNYKFSTELQLRHRHNAVRKLLTFGPSITTNFDQDQ